MSEQIIISLLVFAAAGLAVWGIRNMMTDTAEAGAGDPDKLPKIYRIFSVGIYFFAEEGGVLLENLFPNQAKSIKDELHKAALPMEVKELYGASVFFLVMGVLLGTAVAFGLPRMTPFLRGLLIAILGTAGLIFPRMHVKNLAEKRMDEIMHVLPFAIDLITSSMNAGLDFGAAVRYLLSTGEEDVLRREFAVFLRDVELGKTRTDALKDMQERIGITEFTRFIAAITYGMDSGSSVIDIMRIQAEEMRRVKFARAERQAAKAPTKMLFPMLLFVFPSMFVIIIVPVLLKAKESGLFDMIHK